MTNLVPYFLGLKRVTNSVSHFRGLKFYGDPTEMFFFYFFGARSQTEGKNIPGKNGWELHVVFAAGSKSL